MPFAKIFFFLLVHFSSFVSRSIGFQGNCLGFFFPRRFAHIRFFGLVWGAGRPPGRSPLPFPHFTDSSLVSLFFFWAVSPLVLSQALGDARGVFTSVYGLYLPIYSRKMGFLLPVLATPYPVQPFSIGKINHISCFGFFFVIRTLCSGIESIFGLWNPAFGPPRELGFFQGRFPGPSLTWAYRLQGLDIGASARPEPGCVDAE